jgi:hypothetical protein
MKTLIALLLTTSTVITIYSQQAKVNTDKLILSPDSLGKAIASRNFSTMQAKLTNILSNGINSICYRWIKCLASCLTGPCTITLCQFSKEKLRDIYRMLPRRSESFPATSQHRSGDVYFLISFRINDCPSALTLRKYTPGARCVPEKSTLSSAEPVKSL